MKKMKYIIGALLCGAVINSQAQTNMPVNLPVNPTVQGGIQEIVDAIGSSTNYAIAPYATYAPNIVAKQKLGAGILGIYNLNNYVGTALGVDWLGQFSLVSGNVTLQVPIQPFHNSKIAFLQQVQVVPLGILGMGKPLSGANGDIATVEDVGGAIKFGHFLGGEFGVGATWGKWNNAGNYSGTRYHAFLDWSKGF